MKTLKTVVVVLMMVSMALAGGLVTNTNQSAYYVRTLNRNASTSIDAAYFNPAGLMKLDNGLHAYLSNQSIFQLKTIEADYNLGMNRSEFEGDVKAWLFPNFYLALKNDQWAVSAAAMPIGGGGSAVYDDGVPSFEQGIAQIVPMFQQNGMSVTDYKYNVSFEGSSIYLGFQSGVSYELNEQLSLYAGARYVSASNAYEGYLKDIKFNFGGGEDFMLGTDYFYGLQSQLNTGGDNLQNLINADAGGYTLSQLVSSGQLTDAQATQIKSGLIQAGVPETQVENMDVSTLQSTYYTLAEEMGGYGVMLEDKNLDATRYGYGFTGIFGVNYSPNEDLNIGVRYETITKLTMENDTKTNTTGRSEFEDGVEIGSDMPALLAVGVSYQMSPQIRLESSLNYYFSTNVDWDGREENLDNGMEAGLALEYSLNENLSLSGGYLYAGTAATPKYRSDLDYGLDSHTVGLGLGYKLTENLKLDLGALNTFYIEDENSDKSEIYNKTTLDYSLGVGYSF
ncbi:MAG TPA: outer membrane beta-barrel protein [bacterium]|nr:outer membrane beta-barrel protein [bacterium]